MKDNLSQQLSLFDSSEYQTAAKRPGQKSMDEWLATENPIYHGSGRSDFGNAPMAHYGTRGQAADRASSLPLGRVGEFHRARYLGDGSDEESHHHFIDGDAEYRNYQRALRDGDSTPSGDTSSVYARRLTKKKAPGVFTDQEANAAEYGARLESGEHESEIPRSIGESAGKMAPYDCFEDVEWEKGTARAQAGARALDQGRPIQYHNDIEGANREDSEETPGFRKSIVAPRSAVTSWERDVLDDPGSTSIAQDFAYKRMENGNEGKVPFRSAVENKNRPYQEPLPLSTPTGGALVGDRIGMGPQFRTITEQHYDKRGKAQG